MSELPVIVPRTVKPRQDANLLILQLLEELVWQYPDIRFCQLLAMFDDSEDKFHEEPDDTLLRFQLRLQEIADNAGNQSEAQGTGSKESA